MPNINVDHIHYAIDYCARFLSLSFGGELHVSRISEYASLQLQELLRQLDNALYREAEANKKISQLPRQADIELALRASNGGGLEFRQEYCQCDASADHYPCQYCAVNGVLRRVLKLVKPVVRRRIQRVHDYGEL